MWINFKTCETNTNAKIEYHTKRMDFTLFFQYEEESEMTTFGEVISNYKNIFREITPINL